MIQIMYFARFRELLNCEEEEFSIRPEGITVQMLMEQLAERGGPWSDLFLGQQKLLIAINQEIVKSDAVIKNHDEVAFILGVT